ncbi:MAG: hypothetical protein AB7O37_16185 [Vicinamibacteria bacterium]
MNAGTRVWMLAGLAVVATASLSAQEAKPADAAPALLQIYREEVKPGKDAAHEANEAGWPAAAAKAGLTSHYIAMTSVTGPSEAWFVTPYASWGEWEKTIKAGEASPGYTAETQKLWAQDGELLSRSSVIVASYRPGMSYRTSSNMAPKRYMQLQLIRVKPGRAGEFVDGWREVVAAHEKAKMDESWGFYQVISGMPDGTFLYFQSVTSLADIDKAGPMHGADAYRNAVGESGRARQREMQQEAVDWSQNMLFAFNPKMSYAPKAWADADAFWAPKPAAPAKKGEKKQ